MDGDQISSRETNEEAIKIIQERDDGGLDCGTGDKGTSQIWDIY